MGAFEFVFFHSVTSLSSKLHIVLLFSYSICFYLFSYFVGGDQGILFFF
jgi:hypothetical protein